jgi:hypothetical protein
MPAAMVPMNGAQNAVCADGQNIRPIEHHAWVLPVGDVPRVRVVLGRAAVSSYASFSFPDRSLRGSLRTMRRPQSKRRCGQESGGRKATTKKPWIRTETS